MATEGGHINIAVHIGLQTATLNVLWLQSPAPNL